MMFAFVSPYVKCKVLQGGGRSGSSKPAGWGKPVSPGRLAGRIAEENTGVECAGGETYEKLDGNLRVLPFSYPSQ